MIAQLDVKVIILFLRKNNNCIKLKNFDINLISTEKIVVT